MTMLSMCNSNSYKKKKINTCKNESSGDKREQGRKSERAGNQFKKSIRPLAMLSDF